jgi:hypothetical protein
MTNQHPITPPLELVQQWLEKARREVGTIVYNPIETFNYGAAQAAQWGADQELEACCKWLEQNGEQWRLPYDLRTARRPKPPTLKEQALYALDEAESSGCLHLNGLGDTIRQALEALPND